MARLIFDRISKRFGDVVAVDGLELTIDEGEFVALVGPSGCGKTTSLRILAGLEPVDEGALRVGDSDVTWLPARDRNLAMVFQSYALYPHMTAAENIAFSLQIKDISKAEIERRVRMAADRMGIAHLLHRRPKELSGGQRQRVAVARCIVREPAAFLFDEPLSNLDAELRVQMRVEIAKLHAELGTTMIYVTHDQTEAMTLADRIVVLRDGRIEQIGRPLDLYDDPANQFVAGFLGSPKMNFLEAEVVASGSTGATLALLNHQGAKLTIPVANAVSGGERVVVGIRPEHFREAGKGDCNLQLDVDVVEHLGSTSYVYANTNSPEQLIVQREEQQGRLDTLNVSIPSARVYLFDQAGKRLQ